MSVSPTLMAIQALGHELPKTAVAEHDGVCGLCGTRIERGITPVVPFLPSPEFGAAEHLHSGRNGLICSACAVAVGGANGYTTKFSRALFTPTGAHRLSCAEDIGWMLMHAQPPFVAVFNTRASAHVLWQAPVTYDRSVMGVVIGSMVGTIRPAAVFAAHAALARLCVVGNTAMNAHYQWPVFNLSLYEDATDVCRMIPTHERILRDTKSPEVVADLQAFDDLNQAERWALSAILLARPKRNSPITDFAEPPMLDRAVTVREP